MPKPSTRKMCVEMLLNLSPLMLKPYVIMAHLQVALVQFLTDTHKNRPLNGEGAGMANTLMLQKTWWFLSHVEKETEMLISFR